MSKRKSRMRQKRVLLFLISDYPFPFFREWYITSSSIRALPRSCTGLGISVILIPDKKEQTPNGKYKNNIYVLLSQDNPDIYRDLSENDELPLFVS